MSVSTQDSALVIIDTQEGLMPVMDCSREVSDQVSILVQGARILNLPVICTEQYPVRLGATISDVRCHLTDEPISKLTFSCCGVEEFNTAVERCGRKNIIVAGVEAHVCVFQTVMDLLERGYTPYIVADAISSRTSQNKDIAILRMAAEGAKIVSVEMVLFALLKRAEGDAFKQILGLVK